jgi:hypothetical protein
MSEFRKLDMNTAATLSEVVEAVTRLSTFSEAHILELASTGEINDLFPFRTHTTGELPADTLDETELKEASAMPRRLERRAPR